MKAIYNITSITKMGFGFLTLLNFIFATDNRGLAILIPFILCITSAINNKTK